MTDEELAAILRGDPAGSDELRAALVDLEADGYVLVHRDDLASPARQSWFANYLLLREDTDLLAHVLVDALSA